MGLITSTICAKKEMPALASLDVLDVYPAARCSLLNHFTVTTLSPEKLHITSLHVKKKTFGGT
jgi:hypothetical protein